MRKLIGTATFGGMALAALVACGGTAANATPLTLTGSYTVGESPTIGAPGYYGSPKLPSSFTESFCRPEFHGLGGQLLYAVAEPILGKLQQQFAWLLHSDRVAEGH